MALNQVIARWAAGRTGHRVGDGQCWTFAETALRQAGARTSNDIMGADGVNSDADYVWGTEVSLANVQPGDIVQFRYYSVHIESPDGSGREESRGEPRHTAIVAAVGANGAITVLEQNVPDGGAVRRTTLFFRDSDTVTTNGNWWFYRPIPR